MPKGHRSGDYKVRRAQAKRDRPRFYHRIDANTESAEFKLGCETKRKIKNRKFAKARAKAMAKLYGVVYTEYHCRMCGFYHVGRKRDANRNLIPVVKPLEPREVPEC